MDDLYKNRFRQGSIRLSTWDYGSNGDYFLTICTKDRVPYFGPIDRPGRDHTEIGQYAIVYWKSIPEHYPFVVLDEFIVMPDHIHGILSFSKKNRNGWNPNQFGPQTQNLASVIRGFKGAVKTYASIHDIDFHWQGRYFDRIIRNDQELDLTRDYILDNPRKWLAEYEHLQGRP
ncbi:MAG: hypothetical protein A2X22_11535 [Bacteroidetes bacterium GWF2_49_14]|nr:MAG: hypothetical protein A2X22_11535 [Bacteroidetes bacterium GWF2_49_14]HBB90342.1 hypothetical protein [Bacteroidales bacterium]